MSAARRRTAGSSAFNRLVHISTTAGSPPFAKRSMPRMKAFTPARSSWCIWSDSRDCAKASASSTSRMTPPRAAPLADLNLLASWNACSNAEETSWVISPTRPWPRDERLNGNSVMSMSSCRATLSPMVSANSVLPEPTSPERTTSGGRRMTASSRALASAWCLSCHFRSPVGLISTPSTFARRLILSSMPTRRARRPWASGSGNVVGRSNRPWRLDCWLINSSSRWRGRATGRQMHRSCRRQSSRC